MQIVVDILFIKQKRDLIFDILKQNNITMKLIPSNNRDYILETGKQIINSYPEVYTPSILSSMRKQIATYGIGGGEIDNVLYQSVYDYWLYGLATEEEFYLHFLEKTAEDKSKFITHMDRLNYMRFLNKKEDEYLLKNKYETYKKIKDDFKRDVVLLLSDKDYPTFEQFCQNHSVFVMKPVGLAVSIGIRKVESKDYPDIRTMFDCIMEETRQVNAKYKWATESGVIIEELILQGAEMARLHPASINSIRFTTINIEDKIHVWYPVIRIGVKGNFLCSGAVGSILSGINAETGITETDGFNEMAEVFTHHPDTGIPVKGIQIPKWKELCEKATSLAKQFPTLRYIGWDFVYNHNNEWCVMEANENGEFLSQIAYQTGQKEELEKLIGFHPSKKYWWEGKYVSKFEE